MLSEKWLLDHFVGVFESDCTTEFEADHFQAPGISDNYTHWISNEQALRM
jgi:hypothetical protein